VLCSLEIFDLPSWLPKEPLSSNQLLLIGGALLFLAAILLSVRRTTRVSLRGSPLTEELMIYLARIANALERPQGPSTDEVAAEVLRRLEKLASAKPNGNVRQIPNSMFGREYSRDE
jgi:hypothetical protein